MKPGTKLKSAVDDTEVMVIKAGASAVVVECGGVAMAEARAGDAGGIDPAFADGTRIGKRYTDAEGTIELLCIKPGQGSLSIDRVALRLKDAKPLPSSD